MAPTENRRRGTALIEHTWQGEHGVLIIADTAKGDTWSLPGGAAEGNETPMAAALRGLNEQLGMEPFAALYLFTHAALQEHTVFLVRATSAPGMRDSSVKALGLLRSDLTVAQISLRKRYAWPTAISPSAKKIAQRLYDVRSEQSAFFEAFDTYTFDAGDDEATFNAD